MTPKSAVSDDARSACDAQYVACPRCGFRTHVEANVRDDGAMCCAQCYAVIEYEDT